MFVPVVTKDMPLFQMRQSQVRLKNVRSRAQCLGTHLNSTINNGHSKVYVSTNCIVAPPTTNQSHKQRNFKSASALPTTPHLASYTTSSNSRSPPKIGNFKKQLDPIVEGVAFRCTKNRNDLKKISNSRTPTKILQSTARKKHTITKSNKNSEENNSINSIPNNSTPNLNALKFGNLNGIVSASSSPGLCKPTSSSVNATLNDPYNNNNNNNNNNNRSISNGGIRIVKWLTNTLKGKNKENNKNNDKINCKIINSGKCKCGGENNINCLAQEVKSWKSIIVRTKIEKLSENKINDAKLSVQQRVNAVIGSDNDSDSDLDSNNEELNDLRSKEEENNQNLNKSIVLTEKKS